MTRFEQRGAKAGHAGFSQLGSRLSLKGGNTGYAVNDHPHDANDGIENNPDCGYPDAAFNGVRFLRVVLR